MNAEAVELTTEDKLVLSALAILGVGLAAAFVWAVAALLRRIVDADGEAA